MFWENLLDLVSTVDTPAQANLTIPVRSARSVIMKKVNFVLAVLPEKKDNFICAFCIKGLLFWATLLASFLSYTSLSILCWTTGFSREAEKAFESGVGLF